MDISGYNLRQQSAAISTQSLSLTFTIASTANRLAIANAGTVYLAPAMATSGQKILGFDSARGIDTVAEPIALTAASSKEILTAVDVAPTVSDVASKNCKNFTKNLFLRSSRSFMVIDVDRSKKPVTSACYDKQHVCTYLQPFSHYSSQ